VIAMTVVVTTASVLDSVQDVASIVFALLAFAALLLLLEGLDRV
jgi:hypothetical protein